MIPGPTTAFSARTMVMLVLAVAVDKEIVALQMNALVDGGRRCWWQLVGNGLVPARSGGGNGGAGKALLLEETQLENLFMVVLEVMPSDWVIIPVGPTSSLWRWRWCWYEKC